MNDETRAKVALRIKLTQYVIALFVYGGLVVYGMDKLRLLPDNQAIVVFWLMIVPVTLPAHLWLRQINKALNLYIDTRGGNGPNRPKE